MRKVFLALGFVALFAAPARAQLEDGEILDTIQHAAFNYFWNEANPTLGMIKDRSTSGSPCSIAAVGFGLSAICVGADHGWVTRDDARTRVYNTLHTFYTWPQGTAASGTIGYRGFFYHFLDMNTGLRMPGWDPELSTIDSALLMAGILDAGAYFNDGADTTEAAIRTMADSLYDRMDWTFFRNNTSRIFMGWKPGTGFSGFGQWVGYNEAMIMEILALGSHTYVVPTTLWSSWTSGYSFGTQYGYSYVIFPPLFGHQYSHCWIDFRAVQDTVMQSHSLTYAQNTRRATLAQHAYCIANFGHWVGYSDSLWGITAGDDPNVGYTARGAPPPQTDNGTLSPTAVAGSLPFAPEVCMPTLRNMYNNYPSLWGTYGFKDAFNLSKVPAWYDTDFLGIDQGPIVLMIDNYTGNTIWNRFMQIPAIQNGLSRAGFFPVGAITATGPPPPATDVVLLASEPSPLSGRGTIHFRQPSAGRVRLILFDARGRQVRVLLDDRRPAGDQAIALDTRGLTQGVYVARLETERGSATQKYVVLDR
jgi:hypothetical protein